MSKKYNKLNKKQKKLVRKIMEENSPQRRVDKIVEQVKAKQLAMEILKKESPQARVDKIAENTRKAIEIWNREVNPQLSVDKIVEEELTKNAM